MNRIWLAFPVVAGALLLARPVRAVDFDRDVNPILKQHCLRCHGSDKQEGGLRLDRRQEALAGGNSGAVIVAGNSGQSELIRRVSSTDRDEAMPPDRQRLAAAEIDALRNWIDAGAKWPLPADEAGTARDPRLSHWAWQPLARPPVPEPDHRAWRRNPIDRFVLDKLNANGLAPSVEADARTLIRRLYFDLTGLPPAPEEVEAFVAACVVSKPSPSATEPTAKPSAWDEAYAALVDRLLASPRYGERWARHWLDVVHYGETHGYDKDQPRPNAWPYRDYVIRALNEDKPYARFVEEQIAGDVLYPGTRDGITALGFLAAGPWDLIGHSEVPESKRDGRIARHLDRDDMVGNAIGTFNSLTVQCAQCHAHKFDPIPQEDYYRLHAVFAAVDRADKAYYLDPANDARFQQLDLARKQLEQAIEKLNAETTQAAGPELAELDKRLKELDKATKERPQEYGYHSSTSTVVDEPKWVQVDLGSSHEVSKIVLTACDDNYNNIGPGFGFPVRFKVEASDDLGFATGVQRLLDETSDDVPNPATTPLQFAVQGRGRYVRVTATRLASRKDCYIFALAELEVRDASGENLAAGRPVTALDSIESPPRWRRTNLVDGLSPALPAEALAERETLRAKRTTLLDERVPAALRQELAARRQELAGVRKQLAALPLPDHVYAATVHYGRGSFVGRGSVGGLPRTIHVLQRGDVDKPIGAELGAGALSLVAKLPAVFELPSDHREGDRRAALARWLSSVDNPLTWRSIANRVWQYHFGRGLVETPNDFGRMGQLPSHPELLDWLAVELRDNGGSLKHLHRLIVTSSTYRQASLGRADAEKIDGDNRLLWRMNRRRLEAEALRDSMLQIAGKLDLKMGGPSFQDFAIEHPAHSPHYEYDRLAPDAPTTLRRSIYRFVVRSQPQPLLTVLDCADPSIRVDRRNESLSPLQALAMLNDGFVITMAQHFAERVSAGGGDRAAQIDRAFAAALGRAPNAAERQTLEALARQHGMANACRVLFNLNEFTFVD